MAKKRTVLRVLPAKAWRVGGVTFDSKKDAVSYARSCAISELDRGMNSQVVIHGNDGKIQRELTFGADPRRRKG